MSYDLAKVREEFKEVCEAAGTPCTVPININGRLTRTLGRVKEHRVNGAWRAIEVEFSRQFLETSTDESIRSVILHEAAHYIVVSRTKESHGHDATFKAVCAEIGCDNDTASTTVERTVAASEVYKYQVWCEDCEKVIGNYSRMGKTLKNLKECYCGSCKNSNLKLIQNW